MNRQLFCNLNTIGKNKAETAKTELAAATTAILTAVPRHFCEGDTEISRADVVIDCVDNAEARLLLERLCEKADKVLVHGAIEGRTAQIAVCRPGDGIISKLYAGKSVAAGQTYSFVPAFAAAIEVSEAIKILCGESGLKNELAVIDLTTNEVVKLRI